MTRQILTRFYPFTLLLLSSCSSHTMPQQMTIEFLGFDGCPNTPLLMQRLREAAPRRHIEEIDLMQLETGDPRLGWGAPTILVNGTDLFGSAPSQGGSVSCRNWNSGLPNVQEIKTALTRLPQ